MSSQMKVLVTAIGTVNGGTVVEELNKNHIYTIGANSTPREYVVTSKFVNEYYEFPSAVEDQNYYLEYVVRFCDKHSITHIICFIDEEVESFTRNRKLFEQHGVKVCLADHETVSVCHFKNKFADWIEQWFPEIAIRRYPVNQVDYDKLPLFVKPIEGRASIGCRAIISKSDLKQFMEETKGGENYIIQQLTQGDVVGVDIVRNRKHNQTFIIQKKELMRNSNGCGTVVEIVDDSELKRICLSIAEKIDLNGLINAEFFITNQGPKIIEINPRLPAGTSYSCMAGGNTVINTILIAEGKPCEFEPIRIGKIFARRYETYEM